jgi:proteic killer suppression protein
MAIQSFSCKVTEEFFISGRLKSRTGWGGAGRVVRRKLDMLHYASQLNDLRSPPGNRLQALKGRLASCHSIRVNDQWRVVFNWTNAGPTLVRVVDYH